MDSLRTSPRVQFGPFLVDFQACELLKDGRRIRLQEKPMRLLAALTANPGEVVSREELQKQLWPDETFVDFETGLNVAVRKLREALCDNRENPQYVETIPRHGYRFLGEVDSKRINEPTVSSEQPSPNTSTSPGRPTIRLTNPGPESTRSSAALDAPSVVALRPRWRRVHLAVAAIVTFALFVGWTHLRSQNKGKLSEKDTIVLADFTNTTGDSVFDGTLRQGLAVQLEQSPFFSLISEDRIHRTLQLMDQASNSKLTQEVAREVCQRTGSFAVLDASIAQIGSRYLLMLKAINCVGGESLASTEAQASDKNHVLDALGKATSEMRKKLGESLSSVQRFSVPLEQATTPSLEALQAYSAGIAAMRSKGEIAALPLFKRAVNLDPNFAIAYVQLALCYYNLSEMALAAENATTAYSLRGRVTERERLSIDARFYDLAVGDIERAMQVYEQWKQAYPQDDSPYIGVASFNAYLGRYRECLRDGQQALQLDPERTSAYIDLIECNLALDRLVEADGLVTQAQDHKLEGPFLPLYIYLLAFRRDDAAEMEQAITAGNKRGIEHFLLSAQSDTKAFRGQLNRARELSRLAVESALRDDAKESAAVWHLNAALREAEFGNGFEAKRHVKDGLALASGAYESAMGALALARAGDSSQAEAIVKRVSEQFPNDTMLNNYWLPSVRAAVELNRKNSARAIDALHVTISYALGQPPPLDVVGPMYPTYLRGEAYVMTRNGAAAATEFETILKNPGVVLNFSLGALATVGLARAYALQDETTKAKASYQHFFTLWKDADPDIPILKQAKAEYAKLH